MTAILRVRVRARASRNKVDVSPEGEVRIYVTAAPEAGKANDAIIALLAKALGGRRRSITLVKGHTVRDKVFSIEGLDTDEAMSRLAGD
ncbi:MAG: DUF167 domain-containing protein [SAR202 cluster bacterium]|nr:DUF167 domain-containing protein [SAR202 cluster bacterium]